MASGTAHTGYESSNSCEENEPLIPEGPLEEQVLSRDRPSEGHSTHSDMDRMRYQSGPPDQGDYLDRRNQSDSPRDRRGYRSQPLPDYDEPMDDGSRGYQYQPVADMRDGGRRPQSQPVLDMRDDRSDRRPQSQPVLDMRDDRPERIPQSQPVLDMRDDRPDRRPQSQPVLDMRDDRPDRRPQSQPALDMRDGIPDGRYQPHSRDVLKQRHDAENNNYRERTEIQLADVFPNINSTDPKGTLIRHRRKSHKRVSGYGEADYEDEDDENTLPSQAIAQRNRIKSIKERRQQLEEEKKTKSRPLTLTERYNQLKSSDRVTAGNLATIMRESTLTRVNKMAGGTDSKGWHKFKLQRKAFFDRFTIWSGTLREVEGKFGTAVMTYFRFVKWLMFLNIYLMVIMFCVITVPYLALEPYNFNSSFTDVNVSGYKESTECTQQYITYHENLTSFESTGQKVLDFLQGTGWMERRILFYGVYYNKTYTISSESYTYHMGLAYLLAFGACFLLSFLLIVKNASKNVKVSLRMDEAVVTYCNKIFGAWDFCIRGKKNAKTRRKNIAIDLQAELADQRKEWELLNRVLSEKVKIYVIRFFINLLVLVMLGGALYLITFTTEQMIELQNGEDLTEILELLVQYVPFITITILNLILPIVFQKLVQLEDYRYEFGFKLTLARSILLRLASPIALIAILYKELIEGESGQGQCGNKLWVSTSSRGSIRCWETYFGQQLYKFVLTDLVVETGIIIFVQTPRALLYNKYKGSGGCMSGLMKLVGPQEFDLPQSVVDIIYTQSICWLGMFFSPLIPFMTFLKCLLFFWIKKFAVMKISSPQERPFKTSGSNSLFMLVLLLSFIFAALILGYMVGNISPSQSCGPFRVYNNQTQAVMFDVITNTVYSWPKEARDIFEFLGTVGFFIPVVIILCLLMYYYWLLGQGYKKTEELLQQQLKLEGRDKKYLLDRVNEVLAHNANVLS